MLKIFESKNPSVLSVLFRGSPGPRAENFADLSKQGFRMQPAKGINNARWGLELQHPKWGKAVLAALPDLPTPSDELIEYSVGLDDEEKAVFRSAANALVLKCHSSRGQVLRDRKSALGIARAVMGNEGVGVVDHASEQMWSRQRLDDELEHEAALDVDQVYSIHNVYEDADGDPEQRVCTWLHTHGLAKLGAFDFDILSPHEDYSWNGHEIIRSIAFAILAGNLTPNEAKFAATSRGGYLSFVHVEEFQAKALPAYVALRVNDQNHNTKRSVLCEPRTGLLSFLKKGPEPARLFQKPIPEGITTGFSQEATDLMAERARNTLPVFAHCVEEFKQYGLPMLAKMGYPTDGNDGDSREHLWFSVHGVNGTTIDATLVSQPNQISSMTSGQRGMHAADLLTDWMIDSPLGAITPRDIRPARLIREDPEKFAAFMAVLTEMSEA